MSAATRPRRGLLDRLHDHPWKLAAVAIGISAGAVIALATAAGWGAVADAIAVVEPGWLALCVGAQAVAVLGYAMAFRGVSSLGDRPPIPWRDAVRVVAAGFGAFAPAGGFAIDRRALRDEGGHGDREATVRVLGLGALEYAVLAPAACVSAIELLATNSPAQRAMLWSWAIAVPVGFGIGLWAAAPGRRERVPDKGRVRRALRHALDGVGDLYVLARRPTAWWGMALYWAADIATLAGALRLFGIDLGVAETIVAYATGYAATRRTLPLAGAGSTEVLLALALTWVGVPLAHAVPAVVVYRAANVVLPLLPAVQAHRRLALFARPRRD